MSKIQLPKIKIRSGEGRLFEMGVGFVVSVVALSSLCYGIVYLANMLPKIFP